MKVKEVDRTANIAWSPAAQHPIYLAAGTAAQQLDATFSTTAALEIYGLNLTEPGFDMELKGSIVSDYRFHNIAWGCHGMTSGNESSGVIVGGGDDGNIIVYDPSKILSGHNGLVVQKNKHTGPVRSLDFNYHQSNLLASGGSDSEIFIWDLANPTNPMTPGAKSQPLEDVTCVAWNCQVQHILASTFIGRCIVWDLRKNEPIIKVSDSTSRMRCKVIAWHPAVATQLCIASEDDQSPVIQLWDLRFATSPLKVLENHQRGILSLAWCRQDPDLLVSCGKDSRILCWNPNSNIPGGEVVCELNTSNQWSFNVAWCARNPAVIASSSFDGHVGVYSLMGGQQQVQPSSKIADAFLGSESFAQPPVNQIHQRTIALPLKKPPKWLRKPVGATFSFGGKLVSFENKPEGGNQVTISQVRTNETIMSRSAALEQSFATGALLEFCQKKIADASSSYDKKLWSFIMANFESNPKLKALNLLGYNSEELSKKIQEVLSVNDVNSGVNAEELANRMNSLSTGINHISQQSTPSFVGSQTPDNSRDISRDAFDVIADVKSSADSPITVGFPIPVDNGINGLIAKAILVGNIEDAVNLCLQEDRMADALILAMAGGGDLLQRTQQRYLKTSDHDISKLISAVITNNWKQLVISCDIMYWKEALAAILTYSKQDEFCELCEILGKRLETERNGEYFNNATICYICSGHLDNFVACYSKQNQGDDPVILQDLMEQVLILEKSIEITNIRSAEGIRNGPLLAAKLSAYSSVLATQGELIAAFKYLSQSYTQEAAILKDRIYQNISAHLPNIQPPPFPFNKADVQPSSEPTQMQGIQRNIPSQNPGIQRNVPSNNSQWQVPRPPSTGPLYNTSGPYSGSPQMGFQPSQGAGYHQPQPFVQPLISDQHKPQSSPVQTSAPVNAFQPSMHAPPPPPSAGQSFTPNAPTPPPPLSTSNQSNQKGLLSHRYPAVVQDPSLYSQYSYSQNQVPYSTFPQQSFMHQPAYSTSTTNCATTTSNAPSSQFSQNLYNPLTAQNENPPGAPPTAPTENLYPASMTEFKQGWNDPPILKSSASAKPKRNAEMPAAITQPIFNPNMAQQTSAPFSNIQQNNYNPPAVSQYNYGNQIPDNTSQVSENQQKTVVEKPAPVVEAVQAPIPSEHQIMQDTFENLRIQCCNIVTNPQMKRKLEDVARKLENLYDKLRNATLAENTILCLHQMVQSVQQKNYQAAIAVHTSLITSGNFSEISNFMPGLKVLFQMSMQLGV